jgi:predicted secreted protein
MKHSYFIVMGALCAQAATAGVYIEMVDHDLKTQKATLAQKMYVQNGDGRFVDADGHATLIKNGTFYILDDQEKSYVAVDKATMEQLAKKIAATMEQMKEQLAKLPPEQREQMEKMVPGMGGDKQWTVEALDTGKSDQVDGRACRLWDIKRGGELDDQICVVPYSALPGKENLQAMFANFAKVFEEMAKSVPMLSGMMTNEFGAQAKANGFPVRSRAYDNGKLGDEEQLMKIWREEAIPASMFEIPAEYKRKQMPMGDQ